jgi:hypothetical protein
VAECIERQLPASLKRDSELGVWSRSIHSGGKAGAYLALRFARQCHGVEGTFASVLWRQPNTEISSEDHGILAIAGFVCFISLFDAVGPHARSVLPAVGLLKTQTDRQTRRQLPDER